MATINEIMPSNGEYSYKMMNFESSLASSYRKANGVYYTDLLLSERMLDDLNIRNDSTILDPCCGAGSFIFSAKKKGINNIYGIDLDKNAVSFCLNHIPDISCIQFDSLGNNGKTILNKLQIQEKVDYIIGNPPYSPIDKSTTFTTKDIVFNKKVAESGNNLFVAALIRALEMVKPNGIISYIIPKNFLHISSYGKLRKDLLKQHTIISIVDIGAYFKNVRGEQIILTIQNCLPKDNNNIIIKKLVNTEFVAQTQVPQKYFSNEIILFNSDEDFSIYNKLNSTYQKLTDICLGYIGRGKSKNLNAITGKEIRKFGLKNTTSNLDGNQIFIQNIYSTESGIIAAFAGNLSAGETVTVLTDGNKEMCKFILGILHSRLCNFFLYHYCYNYSKLTMHTDPKYLKKIPLPDTESPLFNKIVQCVEKIEMDEYMSKSWFDNVEVLNKLIYKIYKIKRNESQYIDKEMRFVQSNKWQNNGIF
ncbi:MAG: N-6 DNA methylase [Paludibacteraceae bacterium]|nr:N-6 DNA methylase [Paludibacteraceae bacterium]